jgi:hypothetical protein
MPGDVPHAGVATLYCIVCQAASFAVYSLLGYNAPLPSELGKYAALGTMSRTACRTVAVLLAWCAERRKRTKEEF